MVTEADYKTWTPQQMTHYLDVVTNAFGTNRIMYGSDWPVCLAAAPYSKVIDLAKQYYKTFSQQEQENIFGANAIKFYQIN